MLRMSRVASKMHRALILLSISGLLAYAMAASVPVAPFSFGSSGADAAKWDKLMKYKLWALGSGANTPAITFESDVHITDTVGFVGSPKGGLQFINDQHSLGGPLLLPETSRMQMEVIRL